MGYKEGQKAINVLLTNWQVRRMWRSMKALKHIVERKECHFLRVFVGKPQPFIVLL
jgi:hypothetical protein